MPIDKKKMSARKRHKFLHEITNFGENPIKPVSSLLENGENIEKGITSTNYPEKWKLLETLSKDEKKALVLNRLEQFRTGGPIQLVDVNNEANYIYDKQLQIHLPSKERKLQQQQQRAK